VSIPVSVFTGTEGTRVTRSEFIEVDGTDIPVGRSPIRKDTGDVVDGSLVIRKAEASNGAWVVLTDDEIADATSTMRGLGTIEAFVPIKSLGAYLAEGQVQVRPKVEKGKPNPAADKAFALLCRAMKSRKVVALVKVALRGPARYGLLDSDGTLTLVYTADAVREPRPLPEVTLNKAEVTMAEMLIDAVGVDTPTLLDENAPLVRAFVEAKSSGLAPAVKPTPSPSIDIMSAIAESIDAAKTNKKGKVA
jgi:non-homologous end joining protein Ku